MTFKHRVACRLAIVALASFWAPAWAQQTYVVSTTAPSGPGSLLAAEQAMQSNGQRQTININLPPGSVLTLGGDLHRTVDDLGDFGCG